MIKLPTFGGQSESQSNKEISSLLMLDFYIKSYWKQEASKDQHINISAYQHTTLLFSYENKLFNLYAKHI